MPGETSGEVRPTASGSDAGAYAPGGKMSQSGNAGQSPSVASLAFGQASSASRANKDH
ncbi:hypothetical protein [Mesotoga prima]|uniref:hypothetical protein n=1 Tax=Mesotoga prima TaxID=1184387 RepID=UPI001305172D|nr:hypothetical protein [Mesotoga prima]